MSKILRALKRGLLSVVTVSIVTAGLLVGIRGVSAGETPEFNFMATADGTGDYELMQVRKLGVSAWGDPVTAAPGDIVEFLIYYHNGRNAVAHNTIIKATLPSNYGTSLKATAYIDSDETAPKYDTTIGSGGPVYGKSGGTVNVSGAESKLELVAGSGIWYTQDAVGNLVPHPESQFPNGQKTTNILTTGLNIGDVQGCWQYAGFVYFKAKLISGNPGAYVHKWGAVSGTDTWLEEFNTEPGNYIAYVVHYDNTGSSTATNVRVIDTLPEKVTYATGSAYWRTKKDGKDVDTPVDPSKITVSGRTYTFNFGNVAPGDQNAFFLVFQVKIDDKDSFQVGDNVLINTAQVKSDNGVDGTTNQVVTHVIRAAEPTITFSVDKKVANVTIGQTSWTDHNTASPGDVLAYKINVVNQGNTDAANVVVKDILPNYVTYIAGTTKVYWGTDKVQNLPDGITTASGVVLSVVPAGNENLRQIVFQVKVSTDVPAGTTTLTNKGIVVANPSNTPPWVEASDTATTDIFGVHSLTIAKTVKTTGSWVEQVTAEEGSTVYVRIIVTNNGNSVLHNVVAKDVLPSYLAYVPGSTTIDGVKNSDGITGSGLLLTDLQPGIGKDIRFQVTVLDCPPLGTHTLVNTAYASASGVAQISDTAKVQVTVSRPLLPLPNNI